MSSFERALEAMVDAVQAHMAEEEDPAVGARNGVIGALAAAEMKGWGLEPKTETIFGLAVPVRNVDGDGDIEGAVMCVFQKRDGSLRYIVEDERGCLFIFNGRQIVEREI